MTQRDAPLADRVKRVGNRRGFFARSSMALAGGAVLATEQTIATAAHVFGDDTIRVGVIGCGRRGTAAAIDALQAASYDNPVRLVALADVFSDRLQTAYRTIRSRCGDRVDIGDRRFVGLTAWRNLIRCDVDLLILATPPVYRPEQFEAAVDAGKHVFMESDLATDSAGLDRVRKTALSARGLGRTVAIASHRRFEQRTSDCLARIAEGAIGGIDEALIDLPLAPRSEAHFGKAPTLQEQLRDWQNFAWTGGSPLDPRYWHSIDLVNVIANRSTMGEPRFETGPNGHRIEFRYEGGLRCLTTLQPSSAKARRVTEQIYGTDGVCDLNRAIIRDRQGKVIWRSDAEEAAGKGWRRQFDHLFGAMRRGERIDDSDSAIASSSMMIAAKRLVAAKHLVAENA